MQEHATDQERIVTHGNRSQEMAGADDTEHGRRWGTIAITERKQSKEEWRNSFSAAQRLLNKSST